MRHGQIAGAATLALVASCGFIKVNGKPLGGRSAPASAASPTTSAPASSGSSNGSPTAAPPGKPGEPPAWCKGAGFYTSSDFSPADFADVKPDETNLERTAGQFGNMMCTRGRVTDRDKIMAIRASWMQQTGVDDKDFFVLANQSNRLFVESQDPRQMPGPTSQISDASPAHVMVELDALGPRASMLARYMAAEQCLPGTIRGNSLMMDILCTRDQLDPARAYAEIEKLKDLKLGTRFDLRRMVRTVTARFARKRAAVAAKAKDEPGIAKVIAIADEQFKQWSSPSPHRQKLVAQLTAMEAATKANKRSAFAGCATTTRAAWQEHVAKLTLPKVNAKEALATFIIATLDTAEGYLAYQATRLCSAGSEENLYRGADPIGSDLIRRGPRTATIAAWMTQASTIKFDNRDLDMKTLLGTGELPLRHGAREATFTGQIDGIKKIAGGVEIRFKKVTDKVEDCLVWRETHRIEGFDKDGTIRYRSNCTKWGMVKVDVTPKPMRIGKLVASGLKPGMYLVAIDRLAIVATAGPKSSRPTWVLGATLE